MGCIMSSKEVDSPEVNPAIKSQRRRLSVRPDQVGAIDKSDKREDNKKRHSVQAVDIVAKEQKNQKVDETHVPTGLSKKGYVPYNRDKKNQDSFIIKQGLNGDSDIDLFGAFDGHGEWGHKVSEFVRNHLQQCLEAEPTLKTDPAAAIMEAMKKLCKQLDNSNINIQLSGTTSVYSLRVKDILYTANVGDSRCVLARRGENGRALAVPLSTDHKPDNPVEKARILNAGGRVQALPGNPDEDCGPPRVWLAEMMVPGLAMSRSIGDKLSHKVGVLDIPEITTHRISADDAFVIWATDGVWEFLDNQQVVEIVEKEWPNLKRGAAALIDAANNQWKMKEDVVDDITVVIVGLRPYFDQARREEEIRGPAAVGMSSVAGSPSSPTNAAPQKEEKSPKHSDTVSVPSNPSSPPAGSLPAVQSK